MPQNRRKLDKCLMKRLWDKGTPYLQIGGYFVMLGSICGGVWMAFTFIEQANAAIAVTADYQVFKTQQQISMAVIQQEVHDIHQYLLKDERP